MNRIHPIVVLVCFSSWACFADDAALPIDLKTVENKFEHSDGSPQAMLALETVAGGVTVAPDGYAVRYTGSIKLLDGTVECGKDISGTCWIGPWPFAAKDSQFRVKRFYRSATDVNAESNTSLKDFFAQSTKNSEGWKPGDQGQFALRLDLYRNVEKKDSGKVVVRREHLGIYDTFLSVRMNQDGTLTRLPTILEGPALHLVTSDRSDRVAISLVTDRPIPATVVLGGSRKIAGRQPVSGERNWYRHEIVVDGLEPDREYDYFVKVGETKSHTATFRTAPVKGAAGFRFAFIGDSRGGVGNSMTNVAAVNVDTMERLCGVAARENVRLVLFGGDYSTGYTTFENDFRTQLRVWKQSIAGIADRVPFFTVPGNHEALMKSFADPESRYGLSFDRWPYDRRSTEFVFADEMVNPANGPIARRGFPSYDETAFSFQYGSVKFIGFNTNYWLQADTPKDGGLINQKSRLYGGCPEGYVMSEQLEWLKLEIDAVKDDPTVKFVVLFAHEPMFPNGSHTGDAMWYHGDNRSRAHVYSNGKVRPERLGVIEVRNILARLISQSPKVACVINSDEHALYRTLINSKVPAGDDADIEDGRIDWPNQDIKPISDLERGTWYIVSGGGGAPYSAELSSPWNTYWKSTSNPDRGYRYTPQENILIFEVGSDGISMTARNAFGERIDRIGDLMKVRRSAE